MNSGLHACSMEVATFAFTPGSGPSCPRRAAYPGVTNRQALINLIQPGRVRQRKNTHYSNTVYKCCTNIPTAGDWNYRNKL